jgi:hypothetical protein
VGLAAHRSKYHLVAIEIPRDDAPLAVGVAGILP